VAFIVEAAAKRAIEKIGEEGFVRNISVSVADRSGPNTARVARKLVPQNYRKITGADLLMSGGRKFRKSPTWSLSFLIIWLVQAVKLLLIYN
jgi:hypothetical protein